MASFLAPSPMCCDHSFIGAQVSGGQKEEQTVGITKHLWGLNSSIRAKSCPPSPFRVAGAHWWSCCHCHFCLILTKPIPLLLLKAAACLGGPFSLYSGCVSRFCASFASGWGYWQGEEGLTCGLVKLGPFSPMHCCHPLLRPQVAAPGTPSGLRCFQGDKVQ